jgi:hypothetical protein
MPSYLGPLQYKCASYECIHSNDGATIFSKKFKNVCAGAVQLFLCLHALARLVKVWMLLHHSSAQKISWASVHEFLYSLPMLQYNCLCLPAGVLHWVVLPFHQVFKVLRSPGRSYLFFYPVCTPSEVSVQLVIVSAIEPLGSPVPVSASSALYGYKSEMLNIGDIPMPSGSSRSYAFALNFFRIRHGLQSSSYLSLLYVPLGNLSFLRCARTMSPTSN